MKKYFYTMAVIAIFAIGFAASGEDSDEVRYDDYGRKYYKKAAVCANCGETDTYYWETADGHCSMNKPSNMHWHNGKYYCGSLKNNCFPK